METLTAIWTDDGGGNASFSGRARAVSFGESEVNGSPSWRESGMFQKFMYVQSKFY